MKTTVIDSRTGKAKDLHPGLARHIISKGRGRYMTRDMVAAPPSDDEGDDQTAKPPTPAAPTVSAGSLITPKPDKPKQQGARKPRGAP